MIRVNIKDKEDINRALKRFKKKFEKAQVIKDYRNNAFFTKKSVKIMIFRYKNQSKNV